jgi:uncharacterized protein (TIGR02996 family)
MTVLDEGFFHALQQDPADDATRLVYADFLEEYGDDADAARADLIRVQVELAALAPSSRLAVERAAELTVRQNDLLDRWERVWLGDWASVLDGWAFRRGFVEAIRADASIFLEQAPAWFAQWPTLSVAKLTRVAGHLPELASSPWLAHLRGLDLGDNGIDSGELAHLTASRFVCLLQALDLSDNPIGPRGAMLIAGALSANELSELHLARCGLGWQGLEGLIDGSRRWRRLDLSHNGLDRRDLVRLVDSPVMRNLVALDLAGNRLGDNGASVLADSPGAAGLVDLGLCGTGTGNREVTALATSVHLPKLQSLDLRCHQCFPLLDGERVDRGGIAELSRSPLLGQLRRLLLTSIEESNDWTAEVMNVARRPRRPTVAPAGWVANRLRASRYLIPSQLVECDVEELWWLGDTRNRERLPNPWLDDGLF